MSHNIWVILNFWKFLKFCQSTRWWNSSSEASNAGAFDLIKSDKCDKSVTWQLLFARCINRVATEQRGGVEGWTLSFRTLNSIWCTTRPIWQLSAFLSTWFQDLNPPTQIEIIFWFEKFSLKSIEQVYSRGMQHVLRSVTYRMCRESDCDAYFTGQGITSN